MLEETQPELPTTAGEQKLVLVRFTPEPAHQTRKALSFFRLVAEAAKVRREPPEPPATAEQGWSPRHRSRAPQPPSGFPEPGHTSGRRVRLCARARVLKTKTAGKSKHAKPDCKCPRFLTPNPAAHAQTDYGLRYHGNQTISTNVLISVDDSPRLNKRLMLFFCV